MGIINVTPDSFFGDSRLLTEKTILAKAEQMLLEGATFLDIGGYSTRPGAEEISIQEEIKRVSMAIGIILRCRNNRYYCRSRFWICKNSSSEF